VIKISADPRYALGSLDHRIVETSRSLMRVQNAGEPRVGYRAGFGAGAITRALKLRHTQSSGVAHKSCGDRQIMRKALQFQDACHRAANLPRRGCLHL
jgi:hypothetical protein